MFAPQVFNVFKTSGSCPSINFQPKGFINIVCVLGKLCRKIGKLHGSKMFLVWSVCQILHGKVFLYQEPAGLSPKTQILICGVLTSKGVQQKSKVEHTLLKVWLGVRCAHILACQTRVPTLITQFKFRLGTWGRGLASIFYFCMFFYDVRFYLNKLQGRIHSPPPSGMRCATSFAKMLKFS